MTATSTTVPPTTSSTTPWLVAAIAFTLVDAVATAAWLELGIAREGNPLLAALVEAVGPLPSMTVRAAIGAALLLALAACARRSRLARRALPALTVVLGAVVTWHLGGALLFL